MTLHRNFRWSGSLLLQFLERKSSTEGRFSSLNSSIDGKSSGFSMKSLYEGKLLLLSRDMSGISKNTLGFLSVLTIYHSYLSSIISEVQYVEPGTKCCLSLCIDRGAVGPLVSFS